MFRLFVCFFTVSCLLLWRLEAVVGLVTLFYTRQSVLVLSFLQSSTLTQKLVLGQLWWFAFQWREGREWKGLESWLLLLLQRFSPRGDSYQMVRFDRVVLAWVDFRERDVLEMGHTHRLKIKTCWLHRPHTSLRVEPSYIRVPWYHSLHTILYR